MHPADLIYFWARSNPERPALIQPGMAVTYRELTEAIDLVSERIANYNFSRREPVAVSITHPIHKLAVCFALLRCGICVAPVNQSTLPYLRTNGINNVIYTGEGLMLSGGRNIRFEDSWFKRDGKPRTVKGVACGNHATQTGMIFFTAGAKGIPKKLVVPGDALIAMVRMLPLVGEASYGRVLIVASVNSPFGFNRAALNLFAGRTACFAGDYENQLLLINTFHIEVVSCSALQVLDLVNLIERNKYQLDSLKEVWIDSGYVTNDLVRKIQAHLCRNVITSYNSAEAGRIGYANFDMISEIPNAVGFVAPNTNVEVVDDNDMTLGPGQVGRLRCRSEYYSKIFTANNPECADEVDKVWCYPGDRGLLTKEGILCISGK